MSSTEIHGTCDAQFAAVKEAFAENFRTREEIGACCALMVEGTMVVDLWAGHLDAARTRPWQRDSLVNAWSLGKAMSAITLLHLMDTGAFGPDTRVAETWPEFAAQGKGDITFATLMSHAAGLCAIEAELPDLAFFDWDLMTRSLAAQKPWWEPGTAHGYHTNTFGFLLGEPLRRVTGKRLRDYFRAEIAAPLDADFYMGVTETDLHRCADLVNPPRPPQARSVMEQSPDLDDPMTRMRYRIYTNPSLSCYDYNSPEWRLAEFPSTSPQGNARGVASILGQLAVVLAGKGEGPISRELLTRAIATQSDGEDLNIQRPTRFGLGLQLTQPDRPLGPNPDAFGHYGNGGHLGFADPAVPLAFAYHMNHQGYAWRDPRNIALTDAVYASL